MHSSKPSRTELLCATTLAALATAYALLHVGHPFGIHADEWPKVATVLGAEWPYWHPLWMIDLARLANGVLGRTDAQGVVELGRSLAALSVGGMVWAGWLLARWWLPALPALAVAAACAVLPLVQLHALVFKEDAFVAPWVVLSVWALVRCLRGPSTGRALGLGLCLGMAASAKYSGALMLLLSLAALALMRPLGWRGLLWPLLGAALAVSALVHLPALLELPRVLSGMNKELLHAVQGHDVVLPLGATHGMFHLTQSLLPGLGAPLLVLAVLGLGAPWLATGAPRRELAVLVAAALLWYGVHELSPLKPYPAFQRYMLPLAPLLLVLAAVALWRLLTILQVTHAALGAGLVLLLAALPAALSTRDIGAGLMADPRATLQRSMQAVGAVALFDKYTRLNEQAALYPLFFSPTGPRLVVVSSHQDARFAGLAALGPQSAETRQAAAAYAALLQYPSLAVDNGHPRFGFFNPVLRVVSLDHDLPLLQGIAQRLQHDQPLLRARLLPAQNAPASEPPAPP